MLTTFTCPLVWFCHNDLLGIATLFKACSSTLLVISFANVVI